MRVPVTIRTSLAILTAMLAALPAAAQAPKSGLTMTVDRTVVAPGDVIKVTIESPANATFRGVMLAGTWGVGIIGFAERLPVSFEVKIEPDAPLGKHGLNVLGTLGSGEQLAAGVEIAVEPRELPEWIEPAYGEFELRTPYVLQKVDVRGKFAEGVRSVSESAALRWTSANPRIVSIGKWGWLYALSPGTTTLTATYTLGARSRRTTVQVTVPRPPFSVSPTLLDFGRQVVGTTVMASLTLTNTTNAPLSISKVSSMADESELRLTDDCATRVLAVGAKCTISVGFTPLTAGDIVRYITVATGDENVPSSYEESSSAVRVTGVPAK